MKTDNSDRLDLRGSHSSIVWLASAFFALLSCSALAQSASQSVDRSPTVDFTSEALPSKNTISITLPDSTVLEIDRTRLIQGSGNSYAWIGETRGDPDGSVFFSGLQSISANGDLRTMGSRFEIILLDADPQNPALTIREYDPATEFAIPEFEPVTVERIFKSDFEPIPIAQRGAQGCTDGSEIRVLVAYTSQVSQIPGFLSEINDAIWRANLAFEQTETDIRVTLANTVEVAYDDTAKFSDTLAMLNAVDRLQDPDDGSMDSVHRIRDLSRADVVVLLVANFGSGRAATIGAETADEGFAAVNYFYIDNETFAHELGHLLNAKHDRGAVPFFLEIPFTSNYGYIDPDLVFRTLMAYPDDCSSGGFSCPRLKHFSSPAVDVQYSTGPRSTGTADEDNRSAIIARASEVACFRQNPDVTVNPGATFTDCTDCPTMVWIPGGMFTQGSPPDEPERLSGEGPQRTVSVPAFALGQTEVTFDQWSACVAAGACSHRPDDEDWGRGNRPVINVSWNDAQAYVHWLSETTGENYRLPSEAEWEYAARAGTTTRFNTGRCISTDQANFNGNYPAAGCPEGRYRQRTVPVGSYSPNAWGLRDMHGNVYEWVQDCWNDSYRGAPDDGSPWMTGDCGRAVLRGGSWSGVGAFLRSANRYWNSRVNRDTDVGFRPARSF